MTGFGFSRRFRIKKTDEFSSVFNFRKRVSGRMLVMHIMPNGLEHARVGLIVGKKLARSAVERNYMKRILRELYRHEQGALGGVDILIRPQKAFTRAHFAQMETEFRQLMHKLRERFSAPHNSEQA
ncbi:MAG: ribonuclease P protein component [Methylobacillus sp.]|nr:ribonuclease P protein component [Methylobacillus sp.]